MSKVYYWCVMKLLAIWFGLFILVGCLLLWKNPNKVVKYLDERL